MSTSQLTRTIRTFSELRTKRHLTTALLLLIALSCAPASEATAETEARGPSLGIEAFIVETDGTYFRSSIDAVAAAATGDLDELFPAGTTGTIRQRLIDAEAAGLVDILTAPVLASANGKASVQTGLQLPIQTVTDNTVTVQFVNATLRLDFSIEESDGGRLVLEVDLQKRYPSRLAGAELLAPPIQTTEYHFVSEIDDGGTAAITGVFEHTFGDQTRGRELALLLTVRRLD